MDSTSPGRTPDDNDKVVEEGKEEPEVRQPAIKGMLDIGDVEVRTVRSEPDGQTKTDPASPTERLVALAIRREYLHAVLGLSVGLVAIIGGIILVANGAVGATSWTAKLLGLESQINDEAPGVVLFIVGLFVLWTTRPKVRVKNIRDGRR